MGPFQESKLWLQDLVGLSKDALHIFVGLIVFLLAAFIFRRPLSDVRPLAAVFLVAIAGEIFDLIEWTGPNRDPLWASNWHDLWVTLFWPAMLFALARWTDLLKR